MNTKDKVTRKLRLAGAELKLIASTNAGRWAVAIVFAVGFLAGATLL